jgi:hypothetical protein
VARLPDELSPQQYTSKFSVVIAQVESLPIATEDTGGRSLTLVGVRVTDGPIPPIPKFPLELVPQQYRAPSLYTAQVRSGPAITEIGLAELALEDANEGSAEVTKPIPSEATKPIMDTIFFITDRLLGLRSI